IVDYLQDHSFGRPAVPDSTYPQSGWAICFQTIGHRMAASFFQALLTAAVPGRTALDTYVPATAWGVTLNVLGIFLAARWCGGAARPVAACAALLAGVVFTPLHTAAAHGYLPQLYGTGWMLATVAVAAPSPASR